MTQIGGKKDIYALQIKREQSNFLFLVFVFIIQNMTFIYNTNTLNSLGLENELHKW